MKCPECRCSNITVKYTRHDTKDTILRYRLCKICSHKWFTIESQVQARFIWHKDVPSRIPKTIQREPITKAELAAGETTILCKP